MSGYYLGLLIGALRVPVLVARVGHVRVFAALLSLASTAILFQALFVEPVAWFLMRLLTGYCFAGAFIVAESWLNGSGHERAPVAGCFRSTWSSSWAGWPRASSCSTSPTRRGFDAVHPGLGADLGRGGADAAHRRRPHRPSSSPRDIGLAELYRLSPLGVVGIAGVGIGHGGLFGMGPVYASRGRPVGGRDLDLHGGDRSSAGWCSRSRSGGSRTGSTGAGSSPSWPCSPRLVGPAARAARRICRRRPVRRVLPVRRPVAAALCACASRTPTTSCRRSRWWAPAVP